MKICYLANAASIHTQRWAKHFSNRGFEVTVVSFQPGEIEGIKVIQLPFNPSWSRMNVLLNLGRVRPLVHKIAPDILHAHYVTSYGLAGALAGRHPLVITAWGSDVLVMSEESWIYRQMVRFTLRRADLVTSMADHMTELLLHRRYALPDRIVTLPFGVDTSVFNLDRRTNKHGDRTPLVVSTRRLDHGLDVHLFIQAIPQVLKRCSDVHFVATGDGPLRPQIEKLARDFGISDRIDFRGEVSHHELPRLLERADVFVSTSRSDGNNVSLNEAMACGAFPIATDIPANRAWIKHGHNGLLFPRQDGNLLAERIIEALQKPGWREAVIAQNWGIICKKASWSKNMFEMEHHYFRLLREKRK